MALAFAYLLVGQVVHAQKFEAEDYEYYYDTTNANLGGAGDRNDSVDLEVTSDLGGGLNVGWLDQHEWLAYENLVIAEATEYTVSARVASPNGGMMSIELNGGDIHLGDLLVPGKSGQSGGWQEWQTISFKTIIQPGTYTLGVKVLTSGWNLNWLSVEKSDDGNSGRQIGRIEAETYDTYYDTTAGNSGNAGTRNDDVDIENASDGGAANDLNVGWWAQGEWLGYDKVNFPSDGDYTFSARVASGENGGLLTINIDGSPAGQMSVPATGDWQNWQTVSFNKFISQGQHSVQVQADTNGFNLNWIQIEEDGTSENCAGNVDPRLCVDISKGEWTLMTIPDTQHYSQNWQRAPIAHMRSAFDWIVAAKDDLNIEFVQGLGDIVEWGDVPAEWERSTSAWYKLRGQVPHMPIQGNHDNRWSLNHYFPVSSFSSEYWYSGDSGGIENNYGLMTINGEDYMFLQIETYDQYTTGDGNARPEVGLAWADSILRQYPDRKVILATHDLLGTNTVENALLNRFDNIVMANAGHMCVPARHTITTGPNGGVSHNFVTDFQCDAQEVMFLRYYKFKPQENKVEWYTYSPITKSFRTDAANQGYFPLVQANQ